MTRYIFSVAYVLDGSWLWLGLKKERKLQRKRGQLGIGLYNGFGGLQRPDEPIEITAERELAAESGFTALEMIKCGIALVRHNYDDTEIELHFFLVTRCRGKATESDEMIPERFGLNEIPYDRMWQNDRHTLPLFLSDENCIALFVIDRQGQLSEPPKVKVVPALPKTIDWQSYKF